MNQPSSHLVSIAKSPIQACRYNERVVLHLLRLHKSLSKAALARRTGLTPAAIGGIMSSLLSKGLVHAAGKVQGDMGQPATLFKLEPEGAFGFGVSVNRGGIETLVINFVGEKVASKKHTLILPDPQSTLAIALQDIQDLFESLKPQNQERVAGLGVAQPYNLGAWPSGQVDWESWNEFDLAAELKNHINVPVFSENDGNAGAMAELVYGFGESQNDFAYLFFGPPLVKSLGGGLVLDGDCRRGFTGNAGDIGLMPVPKSVLPTSTEDGDVSVTFLSTRASLHSLAQYLKHCGAAIKNQQDFALAVKNYPDNFDEWLADSVVALELAVQGIQAVLDVPYVVLDSEDEDAEIIKALVQALENRLASACHLAFRFQLLP